MRDKKYITRGDKVGGFSVGVIFLEEGNILNSKLRQMEGIVCLSRNCIRGRV